MARTIDTIKQELTDNFMNDSTLAEKYGFEEGSDFLSVFSRVSLENLILYIVAVGIWTLEKLFDAHREEVDATVNALRPHTLRWYVNKAKDFMYGKSLVAGTDKYDIEGMTDDEVEACRVVKFASCSESSNATLYLKVATEENGERVPLTADQKAAFEAYVHEIKDAGVRVDVVSEPGYYIRISITIYYDPLILTSTGQHKGTGAYPVKETVKRYIENLPFNSEFRLNDLEDALQQTEGVVMVAFKTPTYSINGESWRSFHDYFKPYPGYFKYDRGGEGTTLNNTTYIAYNAYDNNAN